MPGRFLTDTALEVPAVTAEQMQEVARVALEETGPNLFQMTESAGRSFALQALDCLSALRSSRSDSPSQTPRSSQPHVLLLAGSGTNGAGGISAARHLLKQQIRVTLCLAKPDHLSDITRWQFYLFQQAIAPPPFPPAPGPHLAIVPDPGPSSPSSTSLTPEQLFDLDPPADLILDALMGYHLTTAPEGNFLRLIRWANHSQIPILSLDVPSGINSTTGEALGEAIRASWTLTLSLPKTGLRPESTGALFLADIGIPARTYAWKSLRLSYCSPFGSRYRIPLEFYENHNL